MSEFPEITRVLRTFYNVNHGLSEDVAISLFQRSTSSDADGQVLKDELVQAFADKNLSWQKLLLNDEYEVFDASSEQEARKYAFRILWVPIFGR